MSKDTIKKVKRRPKELDKSFTSHVSDTEFVSRILENSDNSIINKEPN